MKYRDMLKYESYDKFREDTISKLISYAAMMGVDKFKIEEPIEFEEGTVHGRLVLVKRAFESDLSSIVRRRLRLEIVDGYADKVNILYDKLSTIICKGAHIKNLVIDLGMFRDKKVDVDCKYENVVDRLHIILGDTIREQTNLEEFIKSYLYIGESIKCNEKHFYSTDAKDLIERLDVALNCNKDILSDWNLKSTLGQWKHNETEKCPIYAHCPKENITSGCINMRGFKVLSLDMEELKRLRFEA